MTSYITRNLNNIFFPVSSKIISECKQNTASPLQWLNTLYNKGIKKQEDEWLNLSSWLKNQPSVRLSKKKILDYISENTIHLEEHEISDMHPIHTQNSMENLTNKKEIVLSIPNIESWEKDEDLHFGRQTNGKAIAWIRFGNYSNQILVIDEIQSARHETGRKFGYKNDGGIIPDAPFKKNWHELCMKRMLHYAALHKYQILAWTSGLQQIKRYDILFDAERVLYTPLSFNKYPAKVIIQPKGGYTPTIHPVNSPEDLIKLVGKPIAHQIDAGQWDLKNTEVGVDGLKVFYDKIIPAFMDKYCKKWGVKTRDIKISGNLMHMIPITQKLAQDILLGQALFRSTDQKNNFVEIFNNKNILEKSILDKIGTLDNILKNNIELINDRSYLPEKLRLNMTKEGQYPGVYDILNDRAYLILNEIRSTEDIEKTIKHEVLGHKGLRALKKERLHEFLDKAYPLIPTKEREQYLIKYADKYVATEEYIAFQAENYKDPGTFDKIQVTFKDCLRTWGFTIPFSNNDIRCILSKGKKALKKEQDLVKIRAGKTKQKETVWIAKIHTDLSNSYFNNIALPMAKKLDGLIIPGTKNIVFRLKNNAIQFREQVENKIQGISNFQKKKLHINK